MQMQEGVYIAPALLSNIPPYPPPSHSPSALSTCDFSTFFNYTKKYLNSKMKKNVKCTKRWVFLKCNITLKLFRHKKNK